MAKAIGKPPTHTLTPTQARAEMRTTAAMLAGEPVSVATVENLQIPGPAGEIPVRTYTPEGDGPFPVLVFFHGGGWVQGDLDTHDGICRFLADGASCVVVSVDYRLAPEHKYPAAVEDAYAATRWVAENAERLQGDATRIAVGGDSSGGNLAAVVSRMARDRGELALVYQLLIYPVTNISTLDTGSYRDYGDRYTLLKDTMAWFRDHYLADEKDGQNPSVSPLLAQDLSSLPPAMVVTAEFDVLRDEAYAYAQRLKQAEIPATYICYGGMVHGFLSAVAIFDRAREAATEMSAALRAAFVK
ncbi:MAG: alpha/beta hydrolase [Chloroflexi bacterium]|nr:alpha/beta hydrolase [Chloroflexota bacterium]